MAGSPPVHLHAEQFECINSCCLINAHSVVGVVEHVTCHDSGVGSIVSTLQDIHFDQHLILHRHDR